MFILGINAYHGGASACLIRDGVLIAAAEEERFERVKYWAGFPVHAINYCLSQQGITPHEIDHIAISRDPKSNIFLKARFALRRRPSFKFLYDRARNRRVVGGLERVFCSLMGVDRKSMQSQFHNVEHHLAHLASAFYVSPFDRAAVISLDGMGDFTSTMWGVGDGSELSPHGSINFPHSMGIVYTTVAQWLGFTRYGDEGKVMGLAPYGEPVHVDKFRKILRVQSDGTFDVDQSFLRYQVEGGTMTWSAGEPKIGKLYSDRFVSLFGEPRNSDSDITSYHKDIASSIQVVLEEIAFALVRKLRADSGCDAICLAGGVALNSCFNGKVLSDTEFSDIFIQPAAGDSGTALGACYHIYHNVLGFPRSFEMKHAYTGPSFDNGVVQNALDANSLHYQTLETDVLARKVAELLAKGKVVGWFQGRMEWGPRALGNRSIITDPRDEQMKDVLNSRIKHRERFRPFAPSIIGEAIGEYFDQSYPVPFMLKVYGVRPDKRSELAAVTHVDGTGRLQTVERDTAPDYWELINAFREITGVPVVLNTSFNENEPIVCDPEQAIACFLRTKMDVLAIGNYLVEK